jgi:hypothetical protein
MLDKRLMAITYNVAAEKIPDVIGHDKSYELNDFDRYVTELIRRIRYVTELIRRMKRKGAKR